MQNGNTQHASWQELLAAPRPASHIVQIYESDAFLVAGVALFAAEGMRRGESVVLTGTPEHLRGIRRALATRDLDVHAAVRQGQLQLSDVHQAVDTLLPDGVLDAAGFQAATVEGLAKASADARFSGVRWWGELSNVLHHAGNTRAALIAEELGDAAVKRYDLRLLCSYLCDKFDARSYDGILS